MSSLPTRTWRVLPALPIFLQPVSPGMTLLTTLPTCRAMRWTGWRSAWRSLRPTEPVGVIGSSTRSAARKATTARDRRMFVSTSIRSLSTATAQGNRRPQRLAIMPLKSMRNSIGVIIHAQWLQSLPQGEVVTTALAALIATGSIWRCLARQEAHIKSPKAAAILKSS